ncbi:glycine/sarcosine/betaine reductase selenoprotein B family protein [Pseudalkalibacillus sp. Hm43]|uniref:glycine/sarcosine/betaine reductase selenoprotein B family protein n=1 Tax=Pseudalkalibacillus sp. Hm43 TaxID=3450742 RepID=UPI003F430FD1
MIEKVEKAVQERWVPSFKYERNEPGAFATLNKPIEEAKGVIITTGGIYVKGQPPFQDHYGLGDPSYREIRHDVDYDQLSIAHEHYDHSKANEDRNVVFPLEMLKHLSEEGSIGSVADVHYSFMGYVPIPHPLKTVTAKEVAEKLQLQQVDFAILVPS